MKFASTLSFLSFLQAAEGKKYRNLIYYLAISLLIFAPIYLMHHSLSLHYWIRFQSKNYFKKQYLPNVLEFQSVADWIWNFSHLQLKLKRMIRKAAIFELLFYCAVVLKDLNFGAFYYIIHNFSCSSAETFQKNWTSPPHFEPQEH